MRFSMRLALVSVVIAALPACSIVYKLPTRQGNVIEQSQINKLQVGMTKKQVEYVMGTPIASSPFDANRWDYLAYYKSPRGDVSHRTVSLFFGADEKLARMQGVDSAGNENLTLQAPNKDALDKERQEAEQAPQSRGPSAEHPAIGSIINQPN